MGEVFNVKVKWGKETYKNVELNTQESPEVFKAQIFCLTGVQPSQQKLLLKGKVIKDDDPWNTAALKNGCLIVMMGSRSEDLLTEPTEQQKFLEDMTEDETTLALDVPPGIENLGNTCYFNAVLQSLRTIPPVKQAILDYTSAPSNQPALLMNSLRNAFVSMEKGVSLTPVILVTLLRQVFPQFGEKTDKGDYAQQDASECFVETLRLLGEHLTHDAGSSSGSGSRRSIVDTYMTGRMENVWKCEEEGGEGEKTVVSSFQNLPCHISQDVKYLHTGILQRLTEKITKRSEALDRDAEFVKTSRITRLPAYLKIDMIRFFYKEKQAINAKILKDVKFPLVLDVNAYCSDHLQKRMAPYRDHFKDMEDRDKEEERARKMGKPIPEEDRVKVKAVPSHFEGDEGSCNSGYYSLQAVLTHQGRTSSSGHYVGWVRFQGGWFKCDDDKVTPVTEDEILKLSGGGDWHCAYVLLYGPRPLTVKEDVTIQDYKEEDKKTTEEEDKKTSEDAPKQDAPEPMET